MKIDRSAPWCHYEASPVDGANLAVLPQEILLRDIVGVEMPAHTKTVGKAYDELKARGEIFLDGQILTTLFLKRYVTRIPLWNHPEFTTMSYPVFAGVEIDFKVLGWNRGFPTLGCDDDGVTPMLNMFSMEEELVHREKYFFAVMRRHN